VVVSAHASPIDLKSAFLPVMAARVFNSLVFGHFRFAAKLDAARFSAFASFTCARADQIPLELRQPA
jgi:hypothetical protein